uniref:Uncharacterized protein AlNc14C91G5698 n=1 Tax=Albugo laibachii Nc14 TaxID=890382 RepID=F0WGG5_9STRA|nr:conserved hypothetical protein [Albugo laibachii Nc14]|eukprot:CCA20328.1 conserved hypothetical protein [Albugo laibachii Nc14]
MMTSFHTDLDFSNSGSNPATSSNLIRINAHHTDHHDNSMKTMQLSPRFGMDELRDFCGPLGAGAPFKTGLTPRSNLFSTGLTPHSGLTPHNHSFSSGMHQSNMSNGPASHHLLTPDETAMYLNREILGFSSPTSGSVTKISPSGYTPKDLNGMKVPLRYPHAFNITPKYEMTELHSSNPTSSQHLGSNDMAMFEYMQRPVSTSIVGSNNSMELSSQDDMDEKRRMKNRERVRKCRKRKQDRLNFLEDRTDSLERENGVLRAKIESRVSEQLTDAELDALRVKQAKTIAAYVRAYNEDTTNFNNSARGIFTDFSRIIYGNGGTQTSGVDTIIALKESNDKVFSLYNIKQYSVQWNQNAKNKCVLYTSVQVSIHPNADQNVPFTSPFARISPLFEPGHIFEFQMSSHLTFQGAKIDEDIRLLNLQHIANYAITEFENDSKKATEVLRSLVSI